MKLKINRACDLASISFHPPRRAVGSSGGGMALSSAARAAGASQQRSQTMSQQSSQGGGGGASFSQGVSGGSAPFSQVGGGASFSQGGGGATFSQDGGGGGASLLHSQSQLSQASLDENLLSIHLPSLSHAQISGLHNDSSKRVPSFPVSAGSCVREESQLQPAKISSNPMHRWNPSLPDSRSQVPSEDVERKFQHLASSVSKMGMVLDSVQNDVMQFNKATKEASLDYASMRQKFALLENSLQQILKGQDDLKGLIQGSIKGNPDHLSVNSDTSILYEISSILAVLPKQVEADLRQLKGDILGTFTKEMEGVVGAVKSLNNRPNTTETLNQSSTTSRKPLMQQKTFSRVTGSPLMNQRPVANGRPQMKQISMPNGRFQMNQTPIANGRSQMNQIPDPKGRSLVNQIPVTKVNVEDPNPNKVEPGKVRAAAEKLVGSSYCRLAPKKEEVAIPRGNPQVPATKAPVSIIIDLDDDDSDSRSSCVLKTDTCAVEPAREEVAVGEDALRILRRARKRRRDTHSIARASANDASFQGIISTKICPGRETSPVFSVLLKHYQHDRSRRATSVIP